MKTKYTIDYTEEEINFELDNTWWCPECGGKNESGLECVTCGEQKPSNYNVFS
jgi:hypothetical protein